MLEWLRELAPDEQARAVRDACNRVVATEPGLLVMVQLMRFLGFLEPLKEPNDVMRHNTAVAIMDWLGPESTLRILRELMGVGGNDGSDTGGGP